MALVKTTLVHGDTATLKADLVALVVTKAEFEKGGKLASAHLKALDKTLGGVLSEVVATAEFEGKAGSEVTLHTHGKVAAARLTLLGGGESGKLDKDAFRKFASAAVKAGDRAKATRVALVVPGVKTENLEGLAEGAQLGAYKFDKYLSDKKPLKVKQLDLVLDGPASKADKAALQLGTDIGDAVNHARDLVNEHGGVMHPGQLAKEALDVAKAGGLKAEILGKKELEKLKMQMFLGVAQGSAHEPKLIHLWWEPAGAKAKKEKPLALVGKAITFDSGGLSLKPADSMMTMKCDMGGGAAILGAMRIVAELKPAFPVHAFIGACENMPSGTAQRPGDVVRARNGKTVEVLNTDAEGRLVLGDVLAWAVEHEPAAIIDLATLTGAITVALGPYMTGLYATDDALAGEILAGAKKAGEEMWRMPLNDGLMELIKGPVADLRNTGGRYGGSITAALFLREFVGKVPWAHLDIAGPAYIEKDRGYDARGGTGHGVRTLVEVIRGRMG